jgi:hypothetical protein
VNEVEPLTDDDERKLIGEFHFLEEVLDFLGVIEVTLPENALDFSDLTSSSCSLDIFEMDLWIFAQVDDRTQVVVVETWATM